MTVTGWIDELLCDRMSIVICPGNHDMTHGGYPRRKGIKDITKY